MTTLRKVLPFTLLCAALSGLPLAAQTQDCSFTHQFTGDDSTWTGVSNLSGNTPCVNWRVTFSATATLTTQVTLQTSPDGSTWTAVPNTICSATVQPPCLFQGTNPTAADAQGMIYASLYGNYVRVITSGSAGAGTATVRGYGVKGASAAALPPGGTGGSGNLIFVTTNPVGACTVGTDVNQQSTVTGAQFTCVGPAGLNNGTWVLILAANSAPLDYYYTNTASDIATYLQATVATYSPITTITFTSVATGTHTLKNWATVAGQPGLTTFAAGPYTQHIHALRVSGGTVTLHTEFWEVSSLGVDIAKIGTTEDTPALTTSQLEYNIIFADSNTYSLASVNSRIVGRLVAVVTGSASTFRVFVGGTADTHMTLPGNVAGNSPVLDPGAIDCPDASGSTTTYTCPTPSPIPTGYATGQLVAFNPQTTNTTTTPTLNVAALGTKNLVAASGSAASLTIGQLVGGSTYLFEYDGTSLRLTSGTGGGGTVTHTGALTSNAVILGNGTADVKPGDVLPADATKFYNGAGHFTTPIGTAAVACPENPISMTIGNTYTCTDNLGVATGKFLWCQDPTSTPVNAAVQVSWAGATINTFTWVAATTETVNCYGSLGGTAALSANNKIRSFGASFGGSGSALTAGITVYTTVPYSCTISAWNITVDTGTATLDLWKIASGTAIPTIANTITASALPAISAGTAIHSTTLTAWTTAVSANDIVGINLKVVSGATYVNLVTECDQ